MASVASVENPNMMRAISITNQIGAAIADERERCARLFESVNPASDDERLRGIPGAGAMGAVIEFRDLIRKQGRV